jgi:DNA-binding protein YbaB
MSIEMHPQVAEALRHAQEFQSALEEQQRRTATETFTGADEAKTVEVIIDGSHALKNLYIEDGLLRLGADEVEERINAALQKAQAAASASIVAQQEQLFEQLSSITGALKDSMGLT